MISSKTEELLKQENVSTWSVAGYVLRCCDTGNTMIIVDGKSRMLVTSEAIELMNPTSGFQFGMEKLVERIETERRRSNKPIENCSEK